jgi:hypothetical protein
MVHCAFHPSEARVQVSGNKATLQINLSPSDWRHAKYLLPHQVRVWRGQVEEILLTVDLHRSAGRFAANWETGRDNIMELAHSVEGARVLPIDYGEEAQARVSAEFFWGARVPAKDFRGGPYYAYFFGLNAARNDLVLHSDSDILFGGGSQSWISEAIADMAGHPEVLFSAPLPGPPAADGLLHKLRSVPDAATRHSHRLDAMSTRIFFLDRARFRSTIRAIVPRPPPSLRHVIKAIVERNPPADLPEHLITREMHARGLVRHDFLGEPPGMWSLHPPYRCADFFDKLPSLVARVEAGDVPEAQRGDHDMNSSLVDWSEAVAAIARNRWWRRLFSRMRTAATSPARS